MWRAAETIVFRVDYGGEIPTAGFFRCLALAQSWLDAGGRAVFVSARYDPIGAARLVAEHIESATVNVFPGTPQDAEQTIDAAHGRGAQWVVLEGECSDGDYQRAIQEAGLRVLVLDDYGSRESWPADFVLNERLDASAAMYPPKSSQSSSVNCTGWSAGVSRITWA